MPTKSESPMGPSDDYTPPPPSISLKDDEIEKYLGSMPQYDDIVTLNAQFRVKEVSDGESWEGSEEKRVVLELVEGEKKKEKKESSKDSEEDSEFSIEDEDESEMED